MNTMQITQHANALYRVHGDRAEAEAAQMVRQCQTEGKQEQAENWQAIRQAVRAKRGPNAS